MPTLFVFRHAKSSWADTGLRDFDRPLANRGLKAAPCMGQYMAEHNVKPEIVLCSTSRRTRESVGLIIPYLSGEMRILFEDGIYEAMDDTAIADRLRRIPNGIEHAMIIGHNPAMQDLTLNLAGDTTDDEMLAAVRFKFPTAALATIDLGKTPWAALAPARGTLTDFAIPRGLED